MPSLPSISHAVSTAAVNLTSSPFDLYGQVLKTAAGNLQADVKSYLDMGLFPILRQILTNQVGTMTGLVNALGESGKAVVTALTTQVPGYLGAAVGDLGKANIEGALNNLQLAIVLPIFAAINPIGPLPKALGNLISQPLQSVINIANDLPNIMLALGVGLIGPVASTLGAMGTATQNVINGRRSGAAIQVHSSRATTSSPGGTSCCCWIRPRSASSSARARARRARISPSLLSNRNSNTRGLDPIAVASGRSDRSASPCVSE